MGRYAYHGQEVLERDGKLVGFNAGYGFYIEHESDYLGVEQRKPKKLIDKNKNHPFNGEIVENPNAVHMMEFSDGNVWITNDSMAYYILMKKTEEERREILDRYINNDDKKRIDKLVASSGGKVDSPEVIALWRAGWNGEGDSISSDYSFMFKDRGLSFVLLDQLTKQDLMMKEYVDNRKELGKKFQKEYKEYLKSQGVGEFDVEYPVGFWNLQISKLNQTDKGLVPEFYLELYHTNHGDWNNDSCLFNVPRHMSGDEIKFLVPIAKSEEFITFADSHSKEEIEEYINAQLENYHEQQRLAQEQEYQIGADSLEDIATRQRTETVQKWSSLLKDKIKKWLHPYRENDKAKSE